MFVQFKKTPFNRFLDYWKAWDYADKFTPDEIVKAVWLSIKLPIPVLKNTSSEYRFFLPCPILFDQNNIVTVPTGIDIIVHDDCKPVFVAAPNYTAKYGLRVVEEIEPRNNITVKLKTDKPIFLKQDDYFMKAILLPVL